MIHVKYLSERPSPELVKGYWEMDSATVHEAQGRFGALCSQIKPVGMGMKVCGPAFTVQTPPGDNLMVLKAVREAKKGDVIVVDCGRITEAGPFGEMLALECQVKGIAGFITTGSVRDSARIREMGFPVFSAGLCIIGTVKESLGLINHPISAGGVIIHPGDMILGDDDGVVVVAKERAAEVLEKSRARVAKEEATMKKIREGASIFDMYGYAEIMQRNGCVEENVDAE